MKWIEDRRRSSQSQLHPADTNAVRKWESEAKVAKPPMTKFFDHLTATLAVVSKAREASKRKSTEKSEKIEPESKVPKKTFHKKKFRKMQDKKKGKAFSKKKTMKKVSG